MQVLEALKADSNLGKNLRAPSVSYGASNLYMQGVLEEETRGNLSKVAFCLETAHQSKLYYNSTRYHLPEGLHPCSTKWTCSGDPGLHGFMARTIAAITATCFYAPHSSRPCHPAI